MDAIDRDSRVRNEKSGQDRYRVLLLLTCLLPKQEVYLTEKSRNKSADGIARPIAVTLLVGSAGITMKLRPMVLPTKRTTAG